MTARRIILASILVGICQIGSSWVLPKCSQNRCGTLCDQSISSKLQSHVFNGDDPDCPEEDECEIDWGSMPGFGDDDEKNEEPNKELETTSVYENQHLIGDETDELEPQQAYVPQVERSIDKSRKILEMNWQIENCEVDEDTCTDFCADCAGSGKSRCKFCRGTRMIAFGNEFRPCLLCVDGRSNCSSCAGTGKIASWAKTHDGKS